MSERNYETSTKKSTTKRIVFIALFVALSYALSFFSFPIFPTTPYFKLDFSNVFILLTGMLFGPVEGVIVCVLKELVRALASGSGGVGEIANAITTSAYILLPATVYRFKKGLKVVIPSLIAACFIGTTAAMLCNRFITFPLFLGAEAGVAAFESGFWLIVAFNMIKTAAVGVLTMLLYKRLSTTLKKLKI